MPRPKTASSRSSLATSNGFGDVDAASTRKPTGVDGASRPGAMGDTRPVEGAGGASTPAAGSAAGRTAGTAAGTAGETGRAGWAGVCGVAGLTLGINRGAAENVGPVGARAWVGSRSNVSTSSSSSSDRPPPSSSEDKFNATARVKGDVTAPVTVTGGNDEEEEVGPLRTNAGAGVDNTTVAGAGSAASFSGGAGCGGGRAANGCARGDAASGRVSTGLSVSQS